MFSVMMTVSGHCIEKNDNSNLFLLNLWTVETLKPEVMIIILWNAVMANYLGACNPQIFRKISNYLKFPILLGFTNF